MGLSEIAAGLEVTARQRERGVAAGDAPPHPQPEPPEPVAADQPGAPRAAAPVVEAYAGGASVGESARAAGLPPVTGAKALHLLGESVCPLGPTGRGLVRDWLTAECSRADALALSGASEREFALAAYVETHDPIPGARDALEGALAPKGDAAVAKRDALDGTMSGVGDLR
jgi:hypothetical protein